MFLVMFPGFLSYYLSEGNPFKPIHLLYGTLDLGLTTLATVLLGLAVRVGDAGPVNAIQNLKTVFQTVITAVVI